MRDDEEFAAGLDDAEAERPAARSRSALSMGLGAGLALAVFGGVGYWLYDLGTRETGRIPVVAAVSGPVKTVPQTVESPVRHRDISSFDLAEAETAQVEPEVLLAPDPQPLSEEDISLRDLEDILGVPTPRPARASASASGSASVAPPEPRELPLVAPDGTAAPQPRPGSAGEGDDLARRSQETETALRSLEAPAPRPAPRASDLPAPLPADPVQDSEADDGTAPRVAPLAPRRPDNLPARFAAAQRDALDDIASLKTQAKQSRHQIQLGAYSSEGEAKEEWSRIAGANTDLLNNRELAVQTTESGGRTWYRLRVGPFASQAEAGSICEALKARDQACIAVINR